MDLNIGDNYKHKSLNELLFTVIAIAPNLDYHGEISYFSECTDGDRIWYVIHYTQELKWFEKIEEVKICQK